MTSKFLTSSIIILFLRICKGNPKGTTAYKPEGDHSLPTDAAEPLGKTNPPGSGILPDRGGDICQTFYSTWTFSFSKATQAVSPTLKIFLFLGLKSVIFTRVSPTMTW